MNKDSLHEFVFAPSDAVVRVFQSSWSWLVPDDFKTILFALSGDVFLEAGDGTVHWLDTGVGELRKAAEDRSTFLELLAGEEGDEWLLRPVVESLLSDGLRLAVDECFGYKTLPVFGGEYALDNMVPMYAGEWYAYSGNIHYQIKDLPDGSKIRFSVTE